MTVLLENRRRARRVRLVGLGSLAWSMALLLWAGAMVGTYGLSPGDGGVFRSWPERLQLAMLLALVGALPPIAMAVYMRLYLIRIVRRADVVELTVLGLWRPFRRDVPRERIRRVRWHPGDLDVPGGLSARAPWMTVRERDRWLPYIVDMQAAHADRRGIQALVAPAQPREPAW